MTAFTFKTNQQKHTNPFPRSVARDSFPDQSYGGSKRGGQDLRSKEAKAFTQNLVLGKEISFEQEVNYKVDKFGRTLGYVFVDGVNLNVELVRNGLARVVLYEKRAKIKYQDELLSAEKEAKEKRTGIWK